MDILSAIGHGIVVLIFWVMAIIAIVAYFVSLGLLIMLILDRISKKCADVIGIGKHVIDVVFYIIVALIVGIFFSVIAYVLSGPADYRDKFRNKYSVARQELKSNLNNVVHFNSQEVKLEKKVQELSDLSQQLSKKQAEVKNLIGIYQNDIKDLTLEIKSEQKRNNIRTFSQAQQHPRISYDLSLIQRKQAYIDKLQETEIKLQNGTYELEFLKRQAVDDLRIVKTLGSEEVENLVKDISKVIEKYMPEAGELAIEVDPRSMQTPEQIWREINR